jgi:twitching motility two-component system response regulator PilH
MRILIADDSPVLRMAVSKLLEPEGYEVVTAEDGVEAITEFYEAKPDLVLLDVQMPKLNGYVVCRLIKEDPSAAHVPVLILTVRSSAEDRYWGAKSGADGYLTKEALGDELLMAIRSTLAGRALSALSGDDIGPSGLDDETDVLTRVCEVLDRKLFEATVVNDITGIATQPVGLDGTMAAILQALQRLVAFDVGGIVLPEQGILGVHLCATLNRADLDEFEWQAAQQAGEFAGQEFPERFFEIRPLSDVEGTVASPSGLGSFLGMPLRSRGQLIAVACLATREADAFGSPVQRTVRTLTPAMAAVVDSAVAYQESLESEARRTFSSLF